MPPGAGAFPRVAPDGRRAVFWRAVGLQAVTPPREPLERPRVLLAIAGLQAASIPWWWMGGTPSIWLGMPSWALVSLILNFAASCLVAYAALRLWGDR